MKFKDIEFIIRNKSMLPEETNLVKFLLFNRRDELNQIFGSFEDRGIKFHKKIEACLNSHKNKIFVAISNKTNNNRFGCLALTKKKELILVVYADKIRNMMIKNFNKNQQNYGQFVTTLMHELAHLYSKDEKFAEDVGKGVMELLSNKQSEATAE